MMCKHNDIYIVVIFFCCLGPWLCVYRMVLGVSPAWLSVVELV